MPGSKSFLHIYKREDLVLNRRDLVQNGTKCLLKIVGHLVCLCTEPRYLDRRSLAIICSKITAMQTLLIKTQN